LNFAAYSNPKPAITMSRKPKPTSLTILKVRRTRKAISIHYRNGDEDHELTSRDNPLPAFLKAIDALPPLVCELLHLPATYVSDMKASGLTISDGSGNEQVTIVAQKSLPDSNGPFNIATPLRLMDLPEAEGSYSPPLTDKQVALVDEVIEQAKAYVLGERAQGQIKFEGQDDEEDGEAKETKEDPKQGKLIELPPGNMGKPAKKRGVIGGKAAAK
jgi:hypothetical protein